MSVNKALKLLRQPRSRSHDAITAVGPQINDVRSGFGSYQPSGGHIPAVKRQFPVAIEKSRTDITEIYSRRTESPKTA